MGRRVVILNGSPRKRGSTAELIGAFSAGAAESGNEVAEFYLHGMDIRGCRGCFGGDGARERPCVQNDDMTKIYPAVLASEVIVLASPLYYWTFSGQLRTAFDRLVALEEGRENLLRGHGRASALLMTAAGHAFEDAVRYYDHLLEYLGWTNLGHVLAGGSGDPGDMKERPEFRLAFELGKSIR